MSSLAFMIRSGFIWRAVPPALSDTIPQSTLPTKERFAPFSKDECKDLHELCIEQYANPRLATKRDALSFGVEAIDRALSENGLRYGTIHEWGVQNLSHAHVPVPHSLFSWFAFRAWTENGNRAPRFIFWIGREAWPSPHTLAQISLGNKEQSSFFAQNIFLDVQGEKERLWSIETALRSSACALVIAPLANASLTISRRLLLAAERGQSIGLFSIAPRMKSMITGAQSRWEVTAVRSPSHHPRWRLDIVKWKGPQPTDRSWEVELSPPSITDLYFSQSKAIAASHERTYAAPEAFSLHIPADVVDRTVGQETARKNAELFDSSERRLQHGG